MSDELVKLATELARIAAKHGVVLTGIDAVEARERALIIAVHDALNQESLESLRDALGPLDLECTTAACEDAAHPDGDGYCADHRPREPDPVEEREPDHKFDLGPLLW